ncbi:MAG: transporter substrate-binding domain-containing protein [Clostridiales bacterium]|nr:transporter substrate-binding domain-containing protein [Clostridiales bacterium]
MKKAFIALATLTAAATALCSLTACTGPGQKVKVIEIELTTEDYAYGINKSNTELLTSVNSYLAEWEDDGSLDILINSYFDGTATFSYKNKTATAQAGDFVVATNAYFPPFESYNDSGAFYGVDIEIAYKIATALEKTLFIKDMEFDSIIADVQNGNSDIAMAGITVNEARLEQVNFATPYYSSAQVITVLEGDTTFADCTTYEEIEAILNSKSSSYTIGTQSGTTGYMYSHGDEDFGYDGFPVTTKAYSTGALAMKDLSNGKINAVILDKQPSLMIAESINKNI